MNVTIVQANGNFIQQKPEPTSDIWNMKELETTTVSNFVMQTFLRKKLCIYDEVIQTLDQNMAIWSDDESFAKAVNRFRQVSRKDNLDLYLADNILKYTLDFKMFQYRKSNVKFFQQYFRARVLANKELAD